MFVNHASVRLSAPTRLTVPWRRPRSLFPREQRRPRAGIRFLSVGNEIDNQTSTQSGDMNMNAFKKTLVAIAAVATLGATGLASTQASAGYYGYGYSYPSYGYGYSYPSYSYGYGYSYGYPSYGYGGYGY